MDYSSEVLRRFERASARPPAALPGHDGGAAYVAGAAEDRSLNVWVRFEVLVGDGLIRDIRFSAFGCPHLIAAADRVVERLHGRDAGQLVELDMGEIARELEVPREKLGKLLKLEDALLTCAGQVLPGRATKGSE